MIKIPTHIKTYQKDGRASLEELYSAYLKLKEFGFLVEKITESGSLPILSLRTPKEGPACWIISGIHGEEPAGPNALAQKIEVFVYLKEKGIPVVLLPLCNPKGYSRDWRYPNSRRDEKKGRSVGDSEHLLPDLKNPTQPRKKKPACQEAEALTAWVLKRARKYPPLLVINFHEDEDLTRTSPYIYSQGEKGAKDQVAQAIVREIQKSGLPLQMRGKTKFGEEIANGIVVNVSDGSIDEFLAAKKIYYQGKVVEGPGAKSAIVPEIPTVGFPLSQRVAVYEEILKKLGQYWQMVQD